LGVVPLEEAIRLTKESGLDLIEVADKARPPVCRIIDYGKYLYQQEKKAKQQKSFKSEVKGIRLSLRIAQNDMQLKISQAKKFLEQGHKVRVEIVLRGREKAHQNLAKEKMELFRQMIGVDINMEQPPKRYPRGYTMIISKGKTQKQTP
jgi:translation initiation factor IF-3